MAAAGAPVAGGAEGGAEDKAEEKKEEKKEESEEESDDDMGFGKWFVCLSCASLIASVFFLYRSI